MTAINTDIRITGLGFLPTLSRYDEMMKDLHLSVIGEKKNPYSYEHELAVQRTLYRITGEN